MKIDVTELDIFYISYDEPNAEENWADLLNKVPWAKRVHGVKGFDAAHKTCAEQSETDRFITVDGDNIVMDEFFNQALEFPEKDHDGNDISESIFSWNAKNLLNGLVYGNGGLKCWPKEYTLGINTHEAATDGEGMEFCWKLNYIQMNDIFMTYNELYKGLERDLGNAIGAALRGDSSGFKKIGENFSKTLTDAIGQGLSKQLMDDLIPEALKPETIQSQIIKGSNFHAQEVQLSIETGAKFHAEAIDGVNAANEQALSRLVNQIIQSGIDVNNVRIANLDTERTFASDEAKRFEGMSTTEGIEKFKKDNPELFAEEARKYYLSTLSGNQLGDVREGERLKKSSDAIINYLEKPENLTYLLSSAGQTRYMKALEDRKTSQDLLENTQSEEEMISNYFGFLNARTMEASEKAKEFNKKVDQLDLEIDTLEAANTAAAGTKVDETLRSTVDVGAGPATVAANNANKEAEENTKKGGENLDKFSTGLNQFAGTIGMFMALAGEDQKTAKLMAAVAKIQLAVAVADQVRIAMETKGGVLKQFAALFGFGGTGARQGGIMSKHGRSYSQGGIAHGPSSGYGAVLHGREAVIPLPNGRSIPVEMGKGQMGTNNTNITVNMAEGSSEVTSDGSKQLAQAIDAAVQNTLEREMRPGGILGGG